jgi:hypothetical protein
MLYPRFIDASRDNCREAHPAKNAKSNRDSVLKVVDAYVANCMFDEADYLFGKKLEDDDTETVKFWNRPGLKAKENGDFQKNKYFSLSA